MALISDIHHQILSSNKLKFLLLATPIVVGSGICLYYYYFSKDNSKAGKKKVKPKSKTSGKLANTPLAKAIELKKEGNKLFGARDYEAAIKLYTEAIAICPPDNKKELATFYQNRAACYEHLKQYDLVIKDCSQAVHYDKLYIKAYLRRGKVNQILAKYEDAVFDFYLCAMSTQFENADYEKLLYSVLEKYSYERATGEIGKRKNPAFQKYLFRHLLHKYSRDPLRKKQKMIYGDYDNIISNLLRDDVDNVCNLDQDQLLLKATIEMYIGKHETGQVELRKLVDTATETDYKVNALLKLAEYYLQNSKPEEAEKCIKEAEVFDASNADVHYLWSQYHVINKQFNEAIDDLKKSIQLEPNYECAVGQKLFIEYQQCSMLNNFIGKARVMKEFEEAIEKCPKSNEILILYFQILLANDDSKKAQDIVIKALENDPEDPTLYVYRALSFIEAGQMEQTKEFLDQALKLDPRCSFAYEILSDLCQKLNQQEEAIDYLQKAIESSTTFEDIKNLVLKQKSLDLQLKSIKLLR